MCVIVRWGYKGISNAKLPPTVEDDKVGDESGQHTLRYTKTQIKAVPETQ